MCRCLGGEVPDRLCGRSFAAIMFCVVEGLYLCANVTFNLKFIRYCNHELEPLPLFTTFA